MQTIPFDFQPRPAASLWAFAAPVRPLSAAVIDAVQMHGDLREDREDGTSTLRISSEALQNAGLDRLGPDALRALDVTLVWDDIEDQLLRVIDAGPLRTAAGPAGAAGPTGNPYADRRMRGFPRGRRDAHAA